jgi:hypothetical protein
MLWRDVKPGDLIRNSELTCVIFQSGGEWLYPSGMTFLVLKLTGIFGLSAALKDEFMMSAEILTENSKIGHVEVWSYTEVELIT